VNDDFDACLAVTQAIQAIEDAYAEGLCWTVDADIKSYSHRSGIASS
jgi:hypothetical protein